MFYVGLTGACTLAGSGYEEIAAAMIQQVRLPVQWIELPAVSERRQGTPRLERWKAEPVFPARRGRGGT
jgi:hypothetical protein